MNVISGGKATDSIDLSARPGMQSTLAYNLSVLILVRDGMLISKRSDTHNECVNHNFNPGI